MLRLISKKQTGQWTDEALLSQYAEQGSSAHLGMLYERYMEMVYGVCLKILKDPALAEDAVLGIYEELSVKAREHQISSFRGWLYVLARNYCLSEWRKHRRNPVVTEAQDDLERHHAMVDAVEFEFPEKALPLQQCLEQLNELQRKCVQWFYYEDKSYKDIALALSEEIGKIRSYIQNGRRNLRICLENAS
jgi:RNA polymerase sigma-70 factor (ECF subfamily)